MWGLAKFRGSSLGFIYTYICIYVIYTLIYRDIILGYWKRKWKLPIVLCGLSWGYRVPIVGTRACIGSVESCVLGKKLCCYSRV